MTTKPKPDDADSAEGVLADARAAGIPGLRKRVDATGSNAREPAVKAETPKPDDDPDSAEGVLADAHRAGLPGLRKR